MIPSTVPRNCEEPLSGGRRTARAPRARRRAGSAAGPASRRTPGRRPLRILTVTLASRAARIYHTGMLFRGDFLDGLATGRLRLAFRRWTRPNVRAGTIMRTAIGLVRVDEVAVVDMAAVSARDARSRGLCVGRCPPRRPARRRGAGLPDRPGLCRAGPQDPAQKRGRALAGRVGRDPGRLRRIDAASRRGPWTLRALTLLAEHPGVRAARLAPLLDRETLAFKRDIRVLKELGLTESLDVGYRLSPRGRAALDRLTTWRRRVYGRARTTSAPRIFRQPSSALRSQTNGNVPGRSALNSKVTV